MEIICRPHPDIYLKSKCIKCNGRLWMQYYYDDIFCENCGIIGAI